MIFIAAIELIAILALIYLRASLVKTCRHLQSTCRISNDTAKQSDADNRRLLELVQNQQRIIEVLQEN